MKNISEIKNDKNLEPYFLDYIRCEEEAADLPEKMPEGVSEEEAQKIIRLAYKVDLALENIIDEINLNYETEFVIDEINEEDEIAEILNETCEYYVEKHSPEKIMQRPLEFINDKELDLEEFMSENDITLCSKCNSEKQEILFDDLPEEIKKEFNEVKDKSEYYLFCPECKEYSIISPN